ncbi:MAG: hypothetical protein WCB68_11080 [Pyrinomonadaceae bacterium]
MAELNKKIEALLHDLPDEEGARLFYERILAEHPRAVRQLECDAGLLADALALAAWSPLLATTLAQHPDYLQWLARVRADVRVKTREELGEALGRFTLTNSQLNAQVLLARFRRRELLRIYLRDIRRISSVVETTEELSNLADAILEYALSLAHQDLANHYGSPLRTDEHGRTAATTFSIIALGKLGSLELNYASDIDLLFIYSDDGETSGKGARGETSNREYYNKLAETVARIVGQPTGEGAAYRVDLRLRPHGRDGALASSLDEAVRYYRETAQAWELQALIRSRSAAGSNELYARFAERVRHRIFRSEVSVAEALANVRLAKQKIDRHHAHDTGGFNVKLGRGGIREIEFIVQALQLAFGGQDKWLRSPHTLVSLGRLADRRFIRERERTQLSDAYTFLRTLEHRLQMEHGLQTHCVPDDLERRSLVARRMSFNAQSALKDFNDALQVHTENVRAAYERIFGEADGDESNVTGEKKETATAFSSSTLARTLALEPIDAETAAARSAAGVFAPRFLDQNNKAQTVEAVTELLRASASRSLNPHRALMLVARVASSLDKWPAQFNISEKSLDALVRLCGASEYFGDMIAGNPSLINALPAQASDVAARNYRALLFEAVEAEQSYRAELSALRRAWAGLIVEIGALDATEEILMREANALQTTLAAASLDAALLIARREMARRYGAFDAEARIAVLGLGRLGGGGMDYGSDTDVVLVYDDDAPSPVSQQGHAEIYARLGELFVAALSSITRDGSLYRVDLRLRPDGRNGATCSGASAFIDYLRERADAWEWLAYVKLRAAAGDLELGTRVEEEARRAIHHAAQRASDEDLRAETRRVRERLEKERTKRSAGATDIKYGAGGMLDVYFATRYLQLRDNVPDTGNDRSTRATLERLRAAGSLTDQDFSMMDESYAHLRSLDHALRLIVGRSTRLPAADHPSMQDIARRTGYASSAGLMKTLASHMTNIRAAYERLTH